MKPQTHTSPDWQNAPVALVSGASRGIGHAVMQTLLGQGWRVSIGTRQPVHSLSSYPEEQWHRAHFDAQDRASEQQWVAEAAARFGRIDAIVHIAGILSTQSVIDSSEDEFDRLMAVNVKSPLRLTQHVWPYLRQAPNPKVVVIASLAGKRVRAPEGSLYSVSKFAAVALAHGIRHCGATDGIRCTAICPGFVATDMADTVPQEIKHQITRPEDIAQLVAMVLSLPASASIAELPVSWTAEAMY